MGIGTPKTDIYGLLGDVLDYLDNPDNAELRGEESTDILVDRVRKALEELENL